jgi:predicted N-acetyltransferase YhbS
LAETLPTEQLGQIIRKYNEITEISDRARDYVISSFKQRNPDNEQVNAIVKHVLRKANEILLDAAKDEFQITSIVEELKNAKAETVLYAAAIKALAKEKPLETKDILTSEMEIVYPKQLENDHDTLIRVFQNNRRHYSPEQLEKSTNDLEAALKDEANRFYVTRHNGEIIGFIRFKDYETDPKRVYAGSFNVPRYIKGSGIGGVLMNAALEIENRDKTVDGVVIKNNPAMELYKSIGFRLIDNPGGDPNFDKIELPPNTVH